MARLGSARLGEGRLGLIIALEDTYFTLLLLRLALLTNEKLGLKYWPVTFTQTQLSQALATKKKVLLLAMLVNNRLAWHACIVVYLQLNLFKEKF